MVGTKVAVVGVGALGEHHTRIYSELPEAELVSVVDVEEERLQPVASRYQCNAYRDYKEVLDSVEAISLAVPTRQHARIGAECLSRGVHVLVEKPIAQNLQEADELIQAQEKSGAILQVGHSERFNPAFLAVKDRITQPRFFEAHRLGVFVPRSLDVDVVLDLMIHDLDLILHLVDSPIREIRAVGIPVITPKTDIANARLEFDNGCVANVTASRVSRERIRKLRLFQSRDYVSIDFHKQDVEMFSLREKDQGRRIAEQSFEIRQEEPLKLEIQTFLATIKNESSLPQEAVACTGQEGKRALALALEVKKIIEQ
ncbi:Gfo/Idh/MocA family oxidoreductase [Acidobacteria bacterium AH-259-D05]|nr:Gfo/Idh/MocA family oxidoreductase [Acidobacteria bacterium AH-259-D05]